MQISEVGDSSNMSVNGIVIQTGARPRRAGTTLWFSRGAQDIWPMLDCRPWRQSSAKVGGRAGIWGRWLRVPAGASNRDAHRTRSFTALWLIATDHEQMTTRGPPICSSKQGSFGAK